MAQAIPNQIACSGSTLVPREGILGRYVRRALKILLGAVGDRTVHRVRERREPADGSHITTNDRARSRCRRALGADRAWRLAPPAPHREHGARGGRRTARRVHGGVGHASCCWPSRRRASAAPRSKSASTAASSPPASVHHGRGRAALRSGARAAVNDDAAGRRAEGYRTRRHGRSEGAAG